MLVEDHVEDDGRDDPSDHPGEGADRDSMDLRWRPLGVEGGVQGESEPVG